MTGGEKTETRGIESVRKWKDVRVGRVRARLLVFIIGFQHCSPVLSLGATHSA